MTIHAELEVLEDLDEELEEFSRLARMGNFREAKSFFDEKLRIFMDKPYVFVQYAEMLLRQGDYKSIQLLDDSRVFPNIHHSQDTNDPYLRNLYHNWSLIQAASLCFTQHEMEPVRNKFRDIPFRLPTSDNLGSTEVRS